MKIAQIVCTFPPYKGGMGNAAAEYARLLSARGRESFVFTPDYGSRKEKTGAKSEKRNKAVGNATHLYSLDAFRADGKEINKIRRLRPFLKYGNAAFLPQLFFRLKNFDAIILHYPFFGAAEVVWLARVFGMFRGKFFLQYHMDVAGLPLFARIMSLPSKIILPGLIRQADKILCSSLDYISESDIGGFYEKYPEKFVELPFGVDLEKFYPAQGESKGAAGKLKGGAKESAGGETGRAAGETKNILFVGGLDQAHYFKGLGTLLKAVCKFQIPLLRQGSEGRANFKFQIIGEGELKLYYKKMAEGLGIADRVKFLGSASSAELPEIYRQTDLLVLPSVTRGEAFGLVLLEAMASGVPVIASDLPGVRRVFSNGIEGYLAEPGNVDDLAEKMSLILSDGVLAEKMGRAGRKLAEEKYDWEKIGDRLNKMIEI